MPNTETIKEVKQMLDIMSTGAWELGCFRFDPLQNTINRIACCTGKYSYRYVFSALVRAKQ